MCWCDCEYNGESMDGGYHNTSAPSGNYIVNITLPLSYPIMNLTILTANFSLPSEDVNPPNLKYLTVSPRFEYDKPLLIEFEVRDDKGVENVTAYYSIGNLWVELPLTNVSSVYNTSITVNSGKEINLKLSLRDGKNEMNYTFLPISLLAHPLNFSFTSNLTKVIKGDSIRVSGRAIDQTTGEPVTGLRLEYYINDEFFDTDKTDTFDCINSSCSYYRWYGYITHKGDFSKGFTIPEDYSYDHLNFTVTFRGSGIYLPTEETITIPILPTVNVSINVTDANNSFVNVSLAIIENETKLERMNITNEGQFKFLLPKGFWDVILSFNQTKIELRNVEFTKNISANLKVDSVQPEIVTPPSPYLHFLKVIALDIPFNFTNSTITIGCDMEKIKGYWKAYKCEEWNISERKCEAYWKEIEFTGKHEEKTNILYYYIDTTKLSAWAVGYMKPHCGDGICDPAMGEACSNCPEDCGTCPPSAGGAASTFAPLAVELLEETRSIDFIPAGGIGIINFTNEDELGIQSIEITAKNSITNVKITVKKEDAKPSEVISPEGIVYSYIRITSNVEEGNVSGVKIKFKVNKTWVYNNSVNKSTIALQRYTSQWEILPTSLVKEDGNYVYYESESPGLSVFAITGSPLEEIKPKIKKCPVCPPPTNWSECVKGKQTRKNYLCGEETNYECKAYIEERVCEISPPKPEFGKLLPIIVLIVMGGIFYWVKFKFKKYKKVRHR